jgi:S-adenosylmethionine:tRNA ribosyltransferase-isomerase
MGKEYFQINPDTVKMIEKTRDIGAKICAVGTTSLRTLETFAASARKQGFTDLFIYPGYKFKMADHLLTNFHLPKTTLFMLVCAFAGEKLAKEAYQQAIDEKYRFYSYGDAMLII